MKLRQRCIELIGVLLIIFIARVRSLKMLYLHVPSTADIFSPVTLRCEYDLEGRNLYSVKWYKDGLEFFRYMPDYVPESRAVKTSGIVVDLQKSDMNMVTLNKLRFNNSGNYKCEVSTEGPNFDTVADSSNMTIMAYPSEDPVIEGVLSTYSLGDYISANCTSGKSKPAANLTWHINGAKADSWDSWVWEYREASEESDGQGLQMKTIGLHFRIHNSHFSSDRAVSPKMEIKCTSIVGNSVRHKSVYPTLSRSLTTNKLAQERQINSAGNCLSSSLMIFILFLTSLQMIFTS